MPTVTDFTRSFLYFRTTRVNHTPRLALAASCTITPPDGTPTTYYMTCTCIGEAMYLDAGLIHQPVSEFRIIAAPSDQFTMIKIHASAKHDAFSTHRFGEVMPTHDGQGAKVVELSVTTAQADAHPITNYDDFRAALLDNRPMIGRTTYTLPETGEQVQLDYPAQTINVAHDQQAWQVDAGPIVMPLLPPQPDELPVARLRPAYLVYNRDGYAEATYLRRCQLGTAATHAYDGCDPIAANHQLVAL